MKRYINFEAIIEGGICLIFSAVMFYTAYSGKYLLFVTPKMKPYLYFTAIMLLIWGASRLKQAGKPKYKVQLSKCLVLVLPLMVMILPYNAMASGTPKAQYTNVAGANSAAGHSSNKEKKQKTRGDGKRAAGSGRGSGSSGQDASRNGQSSGGSGQDASRRGRSSGGSGQDASRSGQSSGGSGQDAGLDTNVPSGLDDSSHNINVSDKEFYQWLVELDQHPDKYEGYGIQMHGTVFHDQTMAEDEFAVTRVLMSCCVADLADCGPICRWQGATDLEAGNWVNVTGTVHFDKTKGIEIIVSQIENAQPADEKYVYPFVY